MALTDNRTQLNDCEDSAQTFATSGAQLGTSNLTGQFVEGSGAIQSQHSNSYEDTYTSGDSAGATFNLGAAGADSTIYLGVKDNLMNTIANAGGMIVVGDGTDRIGYTVLGSDAVGLPYANQYIFCKLDTSQAAASPGTSNVDHHVFAGVEANLNFSALTIVGFGSLHNAKAQGNVPNVFIDNIRYIANDSYAASVTGGTTGTPETMADLVGDDETVGAGMFANPAGSLYYIFAPTEWGAATGNTAFEGTDEQWFYIGDNGGSRPLGATHFPMRLLGGTGTNIFRQTRVTNVNTGTRAQFDWSDSSFDEIELDSTAWINFGAITCPVQDASKFCNNSTFINCDQMDLQSLDMDSNSWNGTTDANGAIVWDENTSDVANQVSSTFVKGTGNQNAIEIAPTGAGPFTYSITNYVFDGYSSQDDVDATEEQKVFFINPSTLSANITINLTDCTALNIGRDNGADTGTNGFSYRLVGSYTGTVTINSTVTLTVTVVDADNAVIEGARVRIELQSGGTLITQGSTNASGIYTDSYNFGGNVSVTIKVRLKGYKNFRTAGTITGDGLNAGVTLADDRIVDLP
jgi:hypothetical protein